MNRIIVALAIIFSLSACSTQQNVNNFYTKYQGSENTMSFKAPLFLTSLMLGNDPEILAFRNKVKSIKVLTINDLNEQRSSAIKSELKQAVARDNFENWFNLNRDGRLIDISAQNRGKSLRNIVISMQGNDNLVFINAKTDLTESELTKFVNRVMEATKDKDEEKD